MKKNYLLLWTIFIILVGSALSYFRFLYPKIIKQTKLSSGSKPIVIDGSQYVDQYQPKSSNIEATKIVHKFIESFSKEGISDFQIINVNSQIEYQKGDLKNPFDYKITRLYDKTENDGSITINFYAWTNNGGLLTNWTINVANNNIKNVFAKIIDVAVGHFNFRTEGFMPAPGTILINERY